MHFTTASNLQIFSLMAAIVTTDVHVCVICLASNRFLKKEFGSHGCTPAQLKAFLEKGN
jgi:hypothetical protein